MYTLRSLGLLLAAAVVEGVVEAVVADARCYPRHGEQRPQCREQRPEAVHSVTDGSAASDGSTVRGVLIVVMRRRSHSPSVARCALRISCVVDQCECISVVDRGGFSL